MTGAVSNRDARGRLGGSSTGSRHDARGTSAGARAGARVSSQFDIGALGDVGAVGSVNIAAVVLAGLASDEVIAAIELQIAGGRDREACSRRSALITLELSGLGWIDIY